MSRSHGLDPEVQLRFGTRQRIFPLDLVAKVLGLPIQKVRGAFLGLLLLQPRVVGASFAHPDSSALDMGSEGETTEGVVGDHSNGWSRAPSSGPTEITPTAPEPHPTPSPTAPLTAADIAAALGEVGRKAEIEAGIKTASQSQLAEALTLTKRRLETILVRNRTSYFLGVLRRLQSPYARTSSSSP